MTAEPAIIERLESETPATAPPGTLPPGVLHAIQQPTVAESPGVGPPDEAPPVGPPRRNPPTGAPSAQPASPEEQIHFWLRRSDQLFVGVLLIAAVGLIGWHWLQLSNWGREPVEISRLPNSDYAYRIDVNQSTWVEWAQLEGIGETLARRIIDDREQRGPFRSIDDIMRVKGIGPKKLEQLRPWLEINVEAEQSLESRTPGS